MDEPSNAEIRAWARSRGHAVAGRGRIPASVVTAYREAHRPAPARRPLVRRIPDPGREALPVEEAHAPGADPPTPEAVAWARPPAAPRGSAGGPPPPPPPPGPPGWGPPPPGAGWDSPGPPPLPGSPSTGRDPFSIASLVLGILPVLCGVLGITFGIIALVRIRRSHQKGRNMAIAGIGLSVIWILVLTGIVVATVAGRAERGEDGSVTGRGSVTANDLRVGDCPSSIPDTQFTTMQLVPCREPHRAEIYSIFPLQAAGFPGDAEVSRFANGGCIERLATYVGPGREDEFDVYFLTPNEAGWRQGDRDVHCLLTKAGGGLLPAGSAKAP